MSPQAAETRPPLALPIRLLRMLWRMMAPVGVAAVVVGAAWAFDASEDIKRQAIAVALFVAGFSFLLALIQELLSPHRRNLRIIPLKGGQAERLYLVARALLFTLLATELLIYLANVNGWNPAVRGLIVLVRNLGLVVFSASAISRLGVFRRIDPEEVTSMWGLARRFIARRIWPVSILVALFMTVANALGYDALSRWVARNAALSLLILLVARMLFRFLRERVARTARFVQQDAAQREGNEAGQPNPAWVGIEKIVVSVLRLVFVVGAVIAILAVWDVYLGELLAQPDAQMFGAFGPRVGDVIMAIAGVVAVLFVGSLLRNLLIFIVFPRADVPVGVRYAILAILRYTVVLVAIFLGLGAFGINTDSLAIFAGAAGFGLMFGLQDIFGNFFSGLIMLLEQPVRVGDAVQIGETSGKVEAVRLRGTTIRTFDNTTVTIPNKTMIGERLRNLSHGMETARMNVIVGVGYDADPAVVEKTLRDVATADERVTKDPAPVVRFQGFGESSLDFQLFAWTELTGDRWQIASDLRAATLEAFRKAGIEIPFAQRDVRIVFDARHEEMRRRAEAEGRVFPSLPGDVDAGSP